MGFAGPGSPLYSRFSSRGTAMRATYTRRRMLRSSVSIAASVALLGCGQKGPLYLPEETEDEKKKKKETSSGIGRSHSSRA